MKVNMKGTAANKMRVRILDFARDNGLVIRPSMGYDYYIESFLMFGCCPCDEDRKQCPCPESLEDIKRDGHCLCTLFWRDHDTFKEKFLHIADIIDSERKP